MTGTPAGTVVTPKNSNLTSSNDADATSYGNAAVTGLTIGDRMVMRRVSATKNDCIQSGVSIILGQGDAIAVTYTGSTGICDAQMHFYFDEETV